jgi:hypothetical protein
MRSSRAPGEVQTLIYLEHLIAAMRGASVMPRFKEGGTYGGGN